jgi:hypothetical protein
MVSDHVTTTLVGAEAVASTLAGAFGMGGVFTATLVDGGESSLPVSTATT